MKKLYTTITAILCLVILATNGNAQFNPGLISNFGIDGDIYSAERLIGTYAAGPTHDWFVRSGSPAGKGMIDTTGSAALKLQLATGKNFLISKGMAFPKFSSQNGKLMMDARYIRDNIGNGGSVQDSTVFTSGSKNGMSPLTWATEPSGTSVIDKTDIVDGFAHMRRDGTTTIGASRDHLVLIIGASTMGTTGNRFLDLELYKEKVDYNKTTGIFSNSGPSTTGGHSEWTFNADGSVKTTGDMEFTFDYNSSSVSEIAIYIWVSKYSHQNIVPSTFRFASSSEFYGDGNSATYGYAKIIAKTGTSLPVWGAVNTSLTSGPAWGTTSKDNGSTGLNYYSTQYAVGQFGEIGIDLTDLGVDVGDFSNSCWSPFSRMIIKSRSSSSFTSALSDFAGPYEFMEITPVSPSITTPGNLACNKNSITLQPQTIVSGIYTWTTTNGNILGSANSATITVNKPGKYYLTTAPAAGCTSQKDSVVVTGDFNKPVAVANRTGYIASSITSNIIATVRGGDEAQSNYATPFGNSQGLLWEWSGPLSFSSTAKDNTVLFEGNYTLVVTEKRNGCKDTAVVYVPAGAVLPVKLIDFSGANQNGTNHLKWNTTEEKDMDRYEIERSIDGNQFRKAGQVKALGNMSSAYAFQDVSASKMNFYRLKMISKDGSFSYSKTIMMQSDSKDTEMYMVYPNPFGNNLQARITSAIAENVIFRILNNDGKVVKIQHAQLMKGDNTLFINNTEMLAKGNYFLEYISASKTKRLKIIKL